MDIEIVRRSVGSAHVHILSNRCASTLTYSQLNMNSCSASIIKQTHEFQIIARDNSSLGSLSTKQTEICLYIREHNVHDSACGTLQLRFIYSIFSAYTDTLLCIKTNNSTPLEIYYNVVIKLLFFFWWVIYVQCGDTIINRLFSCRRCSGGCQFKSHIGKEIEVINEIRLFQDSKDIFENTVQRPFEQMQRLRQSGTTEVPDPYYQCCWLFLSFCLRMSSDLQNQQFSIRIKLSLDKSLLLLVVISTQRFMYLIPKNIPLKPSWLPFSQIVQKPPPKSIFPCPSKSQRRWCGWIRVE